MFQPTHAIRQLPRCSSSRICQRTARLAAGREARQICTRSFASYRPLSRRLRPALAASLQQSVVPAVPTPTKLAFHTTTRCHAATDYTSPSAISMDKYHEIADETMDDIFTKLEERAEVEKELDVEFSAGVLTLDTPNGTYVINKQPPNKQIWLSSPISGPKRYDWIEESRQWVYSRDQSTLSGLLTEEVGIEWD
ncbi:Mitochondrial chaperone Frataxin [Orbilia blumenaviensis]|uniref:ferroxidase n=1 Tax=Orbilia blumenaviensis TaxID=1796055 RepID=A0AAV9VHD4_9PEZI